MLFRLCASFLTIAFFLAIAFPHAGTGECCAVEHAIAPSPAVFEIAGEGCCGEEAEENQGEDRRDHRGGNRSQEDIPPCCAFCHLNWTGIPAHTTLRVPGQKEAGAKPMSGFETWVAGGGCRVPNFFSLTEPPPPPRLAALLARICVRLI